ncbi:hypothetical protein [Frankia sp. QA3]|uniref:hypothetical protein n=1 Tax=Frankia sp. QA3 TaxID=710111 RepID=UPI0002F66E92|nr:hypothetical protein [Frankia sp. QA3]
MGVVATAGMVAIITVEPRPDLIMAGTSGHLASEGLPRVRPPGEGDPDAAHSWAYVGDVARALVAISRDERAWGRVWHAPSVPLSVRELSRRLAVALAEIAGHGPGSGRPGTPSVLPEASR